MKDLTKAGLLAVLACFGVGATGYFAYKAGQNPDKDKKKFILPVATGVATCGLMIASNRVSAGAVAGFVTTTGYLMQHRNELYKEREKDSNWEWLSPPPCAEETGNGNVLCFEGYSGRWFLSEPEIVDDAIVQFNHTYEENGHYASLNDLYEALDIHPTHFGHQYGWAGAPEGYCPDYISFTGTYVEIKDQLVYVIEPTSYLSYPIEGWLEI